MLRKNWLILSVLILIPCISHAKTETIFADHKYVMGDNDSKNDARRMCFLEAKRKVLEKAGTYIESYTQVKNYKLTKDEINSYSAALLKVEVVNEEWKFIGATMAIFMSVKAEVSTDYIEKQLSKIKQDTSVQKKIKDQQRQIQKLERKYTELQKQLATAGSSEAFSLRKERNIVFEEINALQEKKIRITSQIQSKTKNVLEYIELGMTPSEVESLVGRPRSDSGGTLAQGWNYGLVWVVFESGVVSCIVSNTSYESNRGRQLYILKEQLGALGVGSRRAILK